MTHKQIRQQFIDFCVKHGHTHVPADSLVPNRDASVLFTVAGMQQFKDFYEQPEHAPASRVVTIQPCIRTIDIDEVGDDTHSTVFDMIGYFSFGYTGGEEKTTGTEPYFKKVAIELGWKFLTEEMGIDVSRIHATYFGGDAKRPADEAAKQILEQLDGLSLVEASVENFWGPVGEEGPCGPNAEFYVDGVEVWNNVFNQYVRDGQGNYTEAGYRGVDMGTGLERLVAVVQNKRHIYDTDLLAPLMAVVRTHSYNFNERHARIIVDHTKAAMYLLVDGVRPGNKGRDYILRRLIRRIVRAGQLIGFDQLDTLMDTVVTELSEYKEGLAEGAVNAKALFHGERDKFLKTLQQGIKQLESIIAGTTGGEITGEQAFKLFDTYGFPLELTQEIATEAKWTVDVSGFDEQFTAHRAQSRVGSDALFKGGLADNEPQTIAHHTAHHLLLAALRQVLGSHVVQRGSNVTGERLRIDVSHPEAITAEELKIVESLVNQKIEEDLPVINEIMDRDEAYASGALSEFGAKYPKDACVYTIIDQNGEIFSREFCGGPHVTHTGELGRFEILKEEASGAGIRRIRARIVAK